MLMKKDQWPIAITAALSVIIFSVVFAMHMDYEFFIYIGVILTAGALVIGSNMKVKYPNYVLWGLCMWAIIHMAGGGIYINGQKLYSLMFFTLSETYHIFRYDQFAHIFGFGVATLVSYYLLKPSLKKGHSWAALSVVVVMAGIGFGALNEIVEFFATVFLPSTGVGGYINNSVDLVSNLIGALIAIIIIQKKEK